MSAGTEAGTDAGDATGTGPPGRDDVQVLRAALLALAVALLVGGAIWLGSSDRGGGFVAELIEAGDAEALADAIEPSTVPDISRAQLLQAVDGVLGRGPTVEATDVVTVEGVRLVRTVTSDGLVWCATPDGRILLSCNVGRVDAEASDTEAGIGVGLAAVDLFADRATVRVVLFGEEDEVVLEGPFEVGGPDGEVLAEAAEATVVSQGSGSPATGDEVRLPVGSGLLLRFEVDDLDAVIGRTLTVRWADGEAVLDVGAADWFVR